MWTFDDKEYREYGIKGLDIASKAMSKLRRLLAERGIRMTVVVYPWPDQVAQKDLDSLQVRFWREWTDKNNAGFVNLFPNFIDDRPAEDLYKTYYIPYDNHFNELGHQRIAARFLEQWKK